MSTTTLEGVSALLATIGADPIPSIPKAAAHPLARPVDIYRLYLAEILAKAAGCDAAVAYDSLQVPGTAANGDLVLPVPRLRLPKGVKPAEKAAEIAAAFPDAHLLFKKVVANGIHLPFFFTPRPLPRFVLPYIFQRRGTYGDDLDVGLRDPTNPDVGRKTVVIDFSSPNIAKEFHAGHLRSTIIGAYLANLYKNMGWDVVKLNYLGDWGKQFGLLAVGWERYGDEEELKKEPLKHLLDVYARINRDFKPEEEARDAAAKANQETAEIETKGLFAQRNAFFRRMEEREPGAIALWQRFRDISIERYIQTYARLNISFDEYSGESTVQSSSIEEAEKILKEKGIYEAHNGAWAIHFDQHGAKGLGTAIIRGRDGSTTYLLRDVAGVLERERKYNFDKMIYVVSSEQDQYFRRVFKTLELMGRKDLAEKLVHINFGKVEGMSSRLGNVKLLGDILDNSREAMHDVMRRNEVKYSQVEDPDAVAEAVGIAAVMVQDMSGKRINNYPFDMDRMTAFEGDTGPYLQYCHARLNSILRKSDITREELINHFIDHPSSLDTDIDGDKPHGADLLRLMAQYPDVTAMAFKSHEPSTILTYLFRLAHQLSSCYDVIQVKGTDASREVTLARAALYEGARQVLENGMRLLGLSPVDRM